MGHITLAHTLELGYLATSGCKETSNISCVRKPCVLLKLRKDAKEAE